MNDTRQFGSAGAVPNVLPLGGVLYLYDHYRSTAAIPPTAMLCSMPRSARDPMRGQRDFVEVTTLATRQCLMLTGTVVIPANPLSTVFRKK